MIKKILFGILINGAALYAVTKLLTDVQYNGGFMFFVIGGLIIGILNTFVKPLLKILSFPVVILTFGFFSFIINIFIFWLTVKVINDIHFADVNVMVSGFLTYIMAALIFAVVNWLLHIFIPNK